MKSLLRRFIFSFFILCPLYFCTYLILDLIIGWNPDQFFLKLWGSFILHGFRSFIFRVSGLEIPILILVSLGGTVGYSYMMPQDPAGWQPANDPSSGTSASDWRSFEEGVLLEPMPSSSESSEATINRGPVIPELHPPLLEDHAREEELNDRLGFYWPPLSDNPGVRDSFVEVQENIEKHVEGALVDDGYSPGKVLEKRHQIRGFLFYPEGRLLAESTYLSHLKEIGENGTRQSVPYRRIMRALQNKNLFLD